MDYWDVSTGRMGPDKGSHVVDVHIPIESLQVQTRFQPILHEVDDVSEPSHVERVERGFLLPDPDCHDPMTRDPCHHVRVDEPRSQSCFNKSLFKTNPAGS